MHGMGRRFAITLLLALLLPLAAGCTQNSGGQFHSYQTPKKLAEDETSAVDKKQTADVSAAPVTQSAPIPAKGDSKIPKIPATPSGPALGGTAPSGPGSSSAVTTASGSPPVRPPAASNSAASGAVAAKGPQSSGSSTARKVQLLIPNKTFRAEGDVGALRVSYDDIDLLKVLNMDPVPPDAATYMPSWLKALDGRRIRIRGFMYPTFQQTGVHAFGLARDNQICCFGRNPKIYDVFDVVLHEGATTNYIPNRPFDVVGVFHIRPEADAGKLYRLYEMDDAAVMTK
jgi:hypothetical protein